MAREEMTDAFNLKPIDAVIIVLAAIIIYFTLA